jgi:hypothetical protein
VRKYVPAIPPLAHQREALRRIQNKPTSPSDQDVFALLMETGAMKSKVVIDEFGERATANDLTDLLIVAPAGCYHNWTDSSATDPSEFSKQMDPEFYERLTWAKWSAGGGAEMRERLRRLLRADGPRALVVNVESVSSVDRCVDLCIEFAARGRCLMVVDESTTIRGMRSKTRRTDMCYWIGRTAAARRIMSGLVAPKSPLDLYSQFEFLDWRILGHRNFYSYRAKYAIIESMKVGGRDHERTIKVPVAFRNMEELHERIAPYSYRKLKSECLDLPEKVYVPVRHVELTKEQKRHYAEMREFAETRLDEESYVTATMVLTQRMRMDTVLCGFVRDDDGNIREIPEKRTDDLMEVLGEHGGKAIIWTTHDLCVRKIADRLRREYGPRSVAQFWGGNRSTRGEDEARFKGDPECRWMVATQAAGGRGNTWTVASLAVYYNNSDDLEHRIQSEDRVHRGGLKHPYSIVDLCAPGTIDEKKIWALRKKLDIATLIHGDGYRKWIV